MFATSLIPRASRSSVPCNKPKCYSPLYLFSAPSTAVRSIIPSSESLGESEFSGQKFAFAKTITLMSNSRCHSYTLQTNYKRILRVLTDQVHRVSRRFAEKVKMTSLLDRDSPHVTLSHARVELTWTAHPPSVKKC